MKRGLCMILFVLLAGRASAQSQTLDDWADAMLARLPFDHGMLTMERYARFAEGFVDEKRRYYDGVFDRLSAKARARNDAVKLDELRDERERSISALHFNVDLSRRSLFAALSPGGDMVIRLPEARGIVMDYASAADFDSSGTLDDDEQNVAEWCLSTGNRVADKRDPQAVRRQVREVERSQAN